MRQQRLRHRFERIGLAIGIVLVILVVIAVINMVLQSDQGPLEPTPSPTQEPTIGPTAPATPATPEITFDPEPPPLVGSMLHMLGYAPDRLQGDSLPLSDIAQYADIERWVSANGISIPSDPSDPDWHAWNQQLDALAIPEIVATRGTDQVWIDTYGFGLHQVSQILAVGSAPDYVMVMRGNWNEEALLAAWAESGYQAVRVDNVTYWSLYPGGSVDLSAPASRPALGNMNNLVLLEDGTLIATARSGRLEETLRAINDNAPTLADNAEIRTLFAPGISHEQLVTASLLKGTVLEEPGVTPNEALMATPVVSKPQASLMLAGLHLEPDSDGKTTLMIVAVYDSVQEATAADKHARYEIAFGTSPVTGDLHSDRFQPYSMRVLATDGGQALLLMHLKLTNIDADWIEIIEERDLGYLMWPRVP